MVKTSEKPKKRPASSSETHIPKPKKINTDETQAKRKSVTVTSFPRGGASSNGEAKPEKKRRASEGSTLDKAPRTLFSHNETPAPKKKSDKRKSSTSAKKPKFKANDATSDAITFLSYKRVSPGQTFLGLVTEVNELNAVVALPNNIKGYLMINDISKEFTSQLSQKLNNGKDKDDSDSDSDSEDDEEDESIPEMTDLYSVGQYLLCAVKSVDSSKKNVRIVLSTEPSLVNKGVREDTVVSNLVMAATVTSIEDHGCVMDIGIEGMKGFLKSTSSSSPTFGNGRKYVIGEVIPTLVQSVSSKVVTLADENEEGTIFTSSVCSAKAAAKVFKLDSIMPGTLVKVSVVKHLENGIMVKFMKGLMGIIDWFHLPTPVASHVEMCNLYPIEKKLKARVLYCYKSAKKIFLTGAPHLMELDDLSRFDNVTIGEIIDEIPITRVDDEMGLCVDVASTPGYIHISKIEDAKVSHLGKHGKKKYKAGKTLKARIISVNPIENLVCLSTQESVLNAPFLKMDDVRVGQKISGTVLFVSEKGVVVKITENINGFIPKTYLSDAQLSNPAKKYVVNAPINCLVLQVDMSRKKLILTSKKSLIKSKYPHITCLEDAIRGTITHGVATKVTKSGCLLTFFNNIQGYVYGNDLEANGIDRSELFVGKTLKTSVVSVDRNHKRLHLSMNTTQEEHEIDLEAFNNITVGDVVSCTVHSYSNLGLRVRVTPSNAIQFINKPQLSDHNKFTSGLLKHYSRPGTVIEKVLVAGKEGGKNGSSGNLFLTLKQSFKDNFAIAKSIKVGSIYYGFIRSMTTYGSFVQLAASISQNESESDGSDGDADASVTTHRPIVGLVANSNLSEKYISNSDELVVKGQTVRCLVLSNDDGKLSLSMKDAVEKDNEDVQPYSDYMKGYLLDKILLEETAFQKFDKKAQKAIKQCVIGSQIEGTVKSIANYGIFLDIGEKLTGFIIPEHYKGLECEVGDKVKGLALDIDLEAGVIDITLLPEIIDKIDEFKISKKLKKDSNAAVKTEILLVKENYLIALVPECGNGIAVLPAVSFNTIDDKPFSKYHVHGKVSAKMCTNGNSDSPFYSFLGRRPIFALENVGSSSSDKKSKKTKKDSKDVNEDQKYFSDFKQGQIVNCIVKKICDLQLNVELAAKVHGRVHVTECPILKNGKNPLSAFKVGDSLRARILGVHCAKSHTFLPISHNNGKQMLNLTVIPKDIKDDSIKILERPTIESLVPGQTFNGFVHEVDEHGLWVHITPTLRGRVSQMNCSKNITIVKDLATYFKKEQSVKVSVVKSEKGKIDLTILPYLTAFESMTNYPAVIYKILPNTGLLLKLPFGRVGRVAITDVDDRYVKNPLNSFSIGQILETSIIEDHGDKCDLSLRPSRLKAGRKGENNQNDIEDDDSEDSNMETDDVEIKVVDKDIDSAEALETGQIVRGYVKAMTTSGCFITLGRNTTARVLIKDLSDSFIADWKSVFSVGKLVSGKILNIRGNNIDMTLKRSMISDSSKMISFDQLEEGMIITGSIRSIEKYGVFVNIFDTVNRLSGLAHISEISDTPIKKLDGKFTVGDLVKGIVLKVDRDTKRISLSLKPSYVKDSDDDDDVDNDDVNSEDDMDMDNDAMEIDNEEESSSSDDDDDDDDESADEDDQPLDSAALMDMDMPLNKDTKSESMAALDMNAGLAWGLEGGLGGSSNSVDDESDESDNSEDSDDDSEDEEEEEETGNKKASKRQKKKMIKDIEAETAKKENALLEGAAPQTASDFNRLLVGTPNDSMLWVQYMSYHLGMGEINKAREVAEKALTTISYASLEDRLNIWKAFLNFEAQLGNKDSLSKLIQRALQFNDPKVIYIHLLDIHDRTKNDEALFELYETVVKKFGTSKKIWIKFGLSLLKRDKVEETRKTLKRALTRLPKRKHIATISKFAQMEFKYGEPERGRTIFEEILSNYPKRIDLWSIYLDLELRLDDKPIIRNLFERVISLNLSSKKMKYFFKRYLEFERTHGDSATMDHVKQKALEYVEGKMN